MPTLGFFWLALRLFLSKTGYLTGVFLVFEVSRVGCGLEMIFFGLLVRWDSALLLVLGLFLFPK